MACSRSASTTPIFERECRPGSTVSGPNGQQYRARLVRCGTWRSLVAHLPWEQGVAGSNPAVPIDVLENQERPRLLLDVVRSLPADQMTRELRSAGQDVEVKSGGATFHLRTFRAEDFPNLLTPSPDTRMALPADALTQTISRVRPDQSV
jgi:DNA polymerase III beta subunit-like protein